MVADSINLERICEKGTNPRYNSLRSSVMQRKKERKHIHKSQLTKPRGFAFTFGMKANVEGIIKENIMGFSH